MGLPFDSIYSGGRGGFVISFRLSNDGLSDLSRSSFVFSSSLAIFLLKNLAKR
jgi:hypothetical protein